MNERSEEDFIGTKTKEDNKLLKESAQPIFSPNKTRSSRKKENLKKILKDPDPTVELEDKTENDEILNINKDDIFTTCKKCILKPGFFTFSN